MAQVIVEIPDEILPRVLRAYGRQALPPAPKPGEEANLTPFWQDGTLDDVASALVQIVQHKLASFEASAAAEAIHAAAAVAGWAPASVTSIGPRLTPIPPD